MGVGLGALRPPHQRRLPAHIRLRTALPRGALRHFRSHPLAPAPRGGLPAARCPPPPPPPPRPPASRTHHLPCPPGEVAPGAGSAALEQLIPGAVAGRHSQCLVAGLHRLHAGFEKQSDVHRHGGRPGPVSRCLRAVPSPSNAAPRSAFRSAGGSGACAGKGASGSCCAGLLRCCLPSQSESLQNKMYIPEKI